MSGLPMIRGIEEEPIALPTQDRRHRSPAQPSRQGRNVERPEAVVIEPTYVRLKEVAQIRHTVFEHGDAVDSHAPGVALPCVGIEAAILQDIGVNHAAAEDLEPVFAFAETDFPAGAPALNVHFHRRRGEREEAWTKA